MTNDNILQAAKILGTYTGGSFDFWALAGSAKASCRAHVMSVLEGRRMPQSKSGVIALRARFYDAVKPTGGCLAEREENFASWAKNIADA
jgi:hypothetical protein